MDWLFDNTEDSFAIEIGDFITARSILLANITEAIYMAKVKKKDSDASAAVTLTLGSGLTKLAGATEADARLVGQFSSSDFDTNLLSNTTFVTGLGIKTAGMLIFLELSLDDDKLLIVSDFIHD